MIMIASLWGINGQTERERERERERGRGRHVIKLWKDGTLGLGHLCGEK
jgi:hypothetical protein